MEILPLSCYHLLLAAGSLLFFSLWRRQRKTRLLPLPPGPPPWPLLGNLFQLGKRPHEFLYALSQQYGPLMTLHLGMKTTVIVSSPAMAKEVLKTYNHIFAGRTVIEATKALSHHKSSLIAGEYGAKWRNLRRISTVELFSHKRLDALQHLRRDQVFHTIRLINNDKGKVVDIGRTVFCTSLNLLGNMIFSENVFDPHDPASAGFKDSVWEMMKLGGTPNLADFFTFLRFLDPQGVSRRTAKHFKEMYDFVDLFIHKRLAPAIETERLEQNDSNKDFLDVLLDLKSEDFTLVDIRALIAVSFLKMQWPKRGPA